MLDAQTCWLESGNNMAKRLSTGKHHHEESSESENETEPAKIFHRRLSANAKSSVSTIERFSFINLTTSVSLPSSSSPSSAIISYSPFAPPMNRLTPHSCRFHLRMYKHTNQHRNSRKISI
jgi:hypothetical protein